MGIQFITSCAHSEVDARPNAAYGVTIPVVYTKNITAGYH